MGSWSLAAIAGVLLAYIALQTWRPGVVSPAIAFLLAGLIAGTEGLGWIDLSPDAEALRVLAEATLALVLFSDASRIDLRALRDGYAVPARLLGIGLPLTIVLGALAALAVLPELSVAEAFVLAIVLAATDAALGQAVVTDERLPPSIRQGLNVESGLNDGLCVPALVVALALADPTAGPLRGSATARIVGESIGYGLLMGAVAGMAAVMVQRRAAPGEGEERAAWRWLLTPVAAAFAYGLATPLGGSGFIAAFVAGLVYGALDRPSRDDSEPLPAQDLGTLLNAVTILAFGAAFMKPLIERATWQVGAVRAAQPHRRAHAARGHRDGGHPLAAGDDRLRGLVRAARPGVDRLRRLRRGRERPARDHDRRRRRADGVRLDHPARAQRRRAHGSLRAVAGPQAANRRDRGCSDDRPRPGRRRPLAPQPPACVSRR
jgi:NhaP-type Na+/H+ or K+/H+ antiporter